MSEVTDTIEWTAEYVQFINDLKAFHARKGTTLKAEPILGGKKLDLLKIYRAVMAAGGFEAVTKNRKWKHVGDSFGLPSTCTNSAYILKGIYIRNLLGWEEETVWGKVWHPPDELRGPNAHKASTLAGKSFRRTGLQNAQGHNTQSPIKTYTPVRPEPISKQVSELFGSGFTPIRPKADVPFEQVPIRNEPATCAIAELHHQSHPSDHIHSVNEPLKDCIKASNFDDTLKQHVIYGLGSRNKSEVEWALNYIVTVSFESPEKILLDSTPALLELLLLLAQPFLEQYEAEGSKPFNGYTSEDHQQPKSQSFEHILKVLHIVRNFSFIKINAQILAANVCLKNMMIKCLVLSTTSQFSDLGRHCIDILENIAAYIKLTGPFDDCIVCLTGLVFTNERCLLIGAIRTLTALAATETNQVCLIPGSTQIAARITQLLVANDEELIGTVLEYLYQYTQISAAFRLQLLNVHSGADIGLLVSLMMSKSKYFCPKIVRDSVDTTAAQTHPDHEHHHGSVPCVPNLAAYQQLDEPYRCLGWLKDKFEVTDPSSVLSLDDIYLLYEMRFGQEKALKIKDFYTVLKIAFPGASPSGSTSGPVLEGISVRGLQIKTSIIEDGPEILCQWTNCSKGFHDELLLQRHVIQEHVQSNGNAGCMWTGCADTPQEFKHKGQIASHLRTHFGDVPGTSSSSKQQQSSASYVDTSDVKGVALVAAHLLVQLSKDPYSHQYFIPYEMELLAIAQQRPKLASYIQSMFSNFCIAP